MIGARIGNWYLEAEIGRGPHGATYRARGFDDPERRAAVKVLTEPAARDAAFAAKFPAEMLSLQRLDHPNVAKYYDSGTHGGLPYYAVEYVEGTDGAYYRSALIVRADDPAAELADLRGRRAAYNSGHSQSGYNSFREIVSRLADNGRFFSETLRTGSHAQSMRAVIADKADIAAIDPVSLALESEEIRKAIKVIGWTDAGARCDGSHSLQDLTKIEGGLTELR